MKVESSCLRKPMFLILFFLGTQISFFLDNDHHSHRFEVYVSAGRPHSSLNRNTAQGKGKMRFEMVSSAVTRKAVVASRFFRL